MKKRHSRSDHGFDFSRDSDSEGGLHGAHMGRGDPDGETFLNFNELLLDWQLHLGMGKPEEMLTFLGLNGNGGLTAKDWQDMVLGVAAPNPPMIEMLTRVYRETRGDEMPGHVLFSNRARLAWNTAREHRTNDDGQEVRIVNLPADRAEAKPVTAEKSPSAVKEAEPATSATKAAYVEHMPEQSTQSPFYKLLTTRLAELSQGKGISETAAIGALAKAAGIHPWELQGFKPLTKDRPETVSKLVGVLFDSRPIHQIHEPDEHRPSAHAAGDGDARIAFDTAADAFFKSIKGLDIVGGQHNGHSLSYGGLLAQLMEVNRLDTNALAERLGPSVPANTIRAWLNDDQLPQPRTAGILNDLFDLTTRQRHEMATAYDFARCKKKLNYKLREAINHYAGTDQFTPQNLCAAVISATDMRPQDLSYHMGLYPSSLQAFASGEVVPSPTVMKRIAEFAGLGTYAETVEKMTQRHLAKQAPKAIAISRSIGNATEDSSLADIIHTAFAAEGPFEGRLKMQELTLQRLFDGHKTHSTHTKIEELCDLLELKPESHARHMMSEVCHKGSRKPFGMMLADYMAGGGKSLNTFLRQFMSADQGWNLDITELAGIAGLSESGMRTILQKDHIEKSEIVQKFVDRFDLSPKKEKIGWHEQLLWQLSRGDKTKPDADQLVADAQKALREGGDAKTVARDLANALFEKSGLTWARMKALLGNEDNLLIMLRSKDVDLPNGFHPAVMDKLAQVLVPHNARLAHAASNVFLGIAEEYSAAQLLNQAKGGEITIHQLLKTVRKQGRMIQEEFAKAASAFLPKGAKAIEQHNISAWETGSIMQANFGDRIDALASLIGYESETDRADFAALTRGIYVKQENRKTPAQLLDDARAGTISYAGVLKAVRMQRAHERTDVAAKASKLLPAGCTPIRSDNISYWENGDYPIRHNKAWAEALADYIGYAGNDRKDYVTLAMGGRYVKQDERKSGQHFMPGIRAKTLTMPQIIDQITEQTGQSIPQLAKDMGVSPTRLRRWQGGEHAIRFESDALAFARYLNLTEPADTDDFLAFAMGAKREELHPSRRDTKGKEVVGEHTAFVLQPDEATATNGRPPGDTR